MKRSTAVNAPTWPYTPADFEKIPRPEQGWTDRPDRETYFITAIKCVRFSDGSTRKFYLQVAKPLTKKESAELQRRAKKLLALVRADDARALVERERKIFGVRHNRARR